LKKLKHLLAVIGRSWPALMQLEMYHPDDLMAIGFT
jgi:hypothetical protein